VTPFNFCQKENFADPAVHRSARRQDTSAENAELLCASTITALSAITARSKHLQAVADFTVSMISTNSFNELDNALQIAVRQESSKVSLEIITNEIIMALA